MVMSSVKTGGTDRGPHDEDLVAADGDPEARGRALEACRDYLRLVVRRGGWSIGAGPQATSDLVQGTFVTAWRQFSRFRGRTPGELRAWLRAILIHASLNARRRPEMPHIDSGRGAAPALATSPSPSQAAQDKAAREDLDTAIAGLSERHRAIIHLRLWERLSFPEIGRRMDLSEDAVRMIYGRALAKLRELMRIGHDPG